MKPSFTIILLTSFIAISVFGIFAMNHELMHGHVSCIASTAQGADCPDKAGTLAFLNFHFSAFRSLSMVAFNSSLVSILLAALALVIVSSLSPFLKTTTPAFSGLQTREWKGHESFKSPFHIQLTSWLALHERTGAVVSL